MVPNSLGRNSTAWKITSLCHWGHGDGHRGVEVLGFAGRGSFYYFRRQKSICRGYWKQLFPGSRLLWEIKIKRCNPTIAWIKPRSSWWCNRRKPGPSIERKKRFFPGFWSCHSHWHFEWENFCLTLRISLGTQYSNDDSANPRALGVKWYLVVWVYFVINFRYNLGIFVCKFESIP